MVSYAIMYVSFLLLVTSFVAVEWRNLFAAVRTYQVQSVLIALTFTLYAHSLHNPALYYWSGVALLSKGIIIPWLLGHYVLRVHAQEVPPLMSGKLSAICGLLAALLVFRWVFTHHDALVVLPTLAGEPFRMNLAVAAAILVIGLFCLLTRRDGFKVVIGLCLLENAVHLSLVSLAPSIPETALIGVVTDVVITVWMMLYIVAGISRSVGSIDLFGLTRLRG